MRKYDVVCVGGAVIDTFLETGLPENRGEMCLRVGSKILATDLNFSTGGGGTNSAVAFSKLGLKTGFVGKLGRDENGKIILGELKKSNIDFLGSFCKSSTGCSIIIDSKKKNRTILTYKGANDFLDFGGLSKLESDWFYFSSAVGKTLKTQEKLAAIVVNKGWRVAYNPSSYLTRKGIKVLKNLLKNVYVLILNEEEARDLVSRKDLFEELHSFGPQIVCITRGDKGASVSDGVSVYSADALKVRVVEKTGAGDAFASGFVFGLIKFRSILDALKIGIVNSSAVVQKAGAKKGLLDFNGAKKLMRRVSVSKKYNKRRKYSINL